MLTEKLDEFLGQIENTLTTLSQKNEGAGEKLNLVKGFHNSLSQFHQFSQNSFKPIGG